MPTVWNELERLHQVHVDFKTQGRKHGEYGI